MLMQYAIIMNKFPFALIRWKNVTKITLTSIHIISVLQSKADNQDRQTLATESLDLICSLMHGDTLTRLAYKEADINLADAFSLSTNVII